ncbi:MAG TPA: translation initiation factor eIF-2B [Ktedonobacteraceae bacterium]|nr:translation initiation factor eIF-2B [Ktedonobacteraceae bacterium]
MENLAQRIAIVRNDREHGSRWLMREAIGILRDLAQTSMESRDEQMRLLYRAGRELAEARPAMAALTNAVGRVLNVQDGPAAVAQAATHLLTEYDSAPARIASHAAPFLHGCLMTCSISGTVLDVLVALQRQIERVIALEGRPRYEGREMARALSQRGLAVTLITDAQADIFLPECQGVVVGADSVLADGDVLNKAGTALLAWAARGHSIPFSVLCESLKISPKRWSGEPEQQADNLDLLEEKEATEVLEQAIPGVTVRNFYFDRTPSKLVSQIISERGVLQRGDIRAIATKAEVDRQKLFRQKYH